jgi:hypothetical protein
MAQETAVAAPKHELTAWRQAIAASPEAASACCAFVAARKHFVASWPERPTASKRVATPPQLQYRVGNFFH